MADKSGTIQDLGSRKYKQAFICPFKLFDMQVNRTFVSFLLASTHRAVRAMLRGSPDDHSLPLK